MSNVNLNELSRPGIKLFDAGSLTACIFRQHTAPGLLIWQMNQINLSVVWLMVRISMEGPYRPGPDRIRVCAWLR